MNEFSLDGRDGRDRRDVDICISSNLHCGLLVTRQPRGWSNRSAGRHLHRRSRKTTMIGVSESNLCSMITLTGSMLFNYFEPKLTMSGHGTERQTNSGG